MLSVWEQMHGYDDIVAHDFAPTYYCGSCGRMMESSKSHRFECPACHMIYSEPHKLNLS